MRIIAIVGQTASGKTDLSLKLAKKYNGEIVSADSRQVYRGMNVGTGKVTKTEQKIVKHWLIDIVSPKTEFNVSKFKKRAESVLKDIWERGKIPTLCGGTNFWVDSLLYSLDFPKVLPNKKLRKGLNKKRVEKLFLELKKIDRERSRDIDKYNKVRLIRAIEVAKALGTVPPVRKNKKYDFLKIGMKISKEVLHKNIQKRVMRMLKRGMVKEIYNLHFYNNVSWKRLGELGLESRIISEYIRGFISKEQMIEGIVIETKKFAKRQMTWLKKDKDIRWVSNYREANKLVKKFLEN